MRIIGRVLLLTTLFLPLLPTHADDAALVSLRKQLASHDAAAWDSAQTMRAQWESDPAFDYLYGLAALQAKKYNEAQFALERVMFAQPSNMHARLALAKAYYHLGDRESARKQFEVVKSSNPPGNIVRDINTYLGLARSDSNKASITGYVEALIGHDNNVNSATHDNFINSPLFPLPPLTIANEARQHSDMFERFNAGGEYYKPLSDTLAVDVKGRTGGQNNFSTDGYDTNYYFGSASLRKQVGDDTFRVTAAMQESRLSDSDNQRYYSLSGDWVHQINANWNYFASVFVNELRYPDDALRDIHQRVANVGLQQQWGDLTHSAGFLVGDEDALRSAGEQNARFFTAVFYDARYDINYQHQIYGRVYVQDSRQQNNDPFFLQVRDDTAEQISMGWAWQLTPHVRWKTETGYVHDDSDIDYYSYNRAYIQTGVRYTF